MLARARLKAHRRAELPSVRAFSPCSGCGLRKMKPVQGRRHRQKLHAHHLQQQYTKLCQHQVALAHAASHLCACRCSPPRPQVNLLRASRGLSDAAGARRCRLFRRQGHAASGSACRHQLRRQHRTTPQRCRALPRGWSLTRSRGNTRVQSPGRGMLRGCPCSPEYANRDFDRELRACQQGF